MDDAGMTKRHTSRTLTHLFVAALVIVVAACGGSDSKTASGQSAYSSGPSTSVVESVSSSSTVTDEGEAIRTGTPLEAKRYKVIDARVPLVTSFVTPEGSFGDAPGALISLSLDPAGMQMLMAVFYLEQARTFTDPDPVVDEGTDFLAVTEEAGDDYLAHFATLPSFEVGPVQDATVAGRPARSLKYKMTAPSGNTAGCGGPPTTTCVAVTYFSSGRTFVYLSGDSGTLYQVEVDGHQVVVDVSDRPGASDVLASLHILPS